MVIKIDGKALEVKAGRTILEVARENRIHIPTLCYLKDINEAGACRVCSVELEGKNRLLAACNTQAEEGMSILTNSPRVRRDRRAVVELLLSEHKCDCPTCAKSGSCALQKLANDLGILSQPYESKIKAARWPASYPFIRDSSKCIGCLRCVQVCDKVQGLGIWELSGTGARAQIGVSEGRSILEADCALCGQCVSHCPTGALRERDDTQRVLDALADPEKTVVFQVAPAVRSAWGEYWGTDRAQAAPKLLVSAIKKLGADYVFDTGLAADLTIMEEGSELVKKLAEGSINGQPLMTSCCPGWVRYISMHYPEMAFTLSTAKSPQQMMGAVIKSYFAEKQNIDPQSIYSVSVMPCVAKKYECDKQQRVNEQGYPEVDVVITTRELVRMLRADGIDPASLPEQDFDSPLGCGTGAGVIFGASGGVMEAALRSAHFLITGENPAPDAFSAIRGKEGWREGIFKIGDNELKCAAVNGLANARRLLETLRCGEAKYDFVEVMACPGGCAGGGGQPTRDGFELAGERGDYLYELDVGASLRFSHENPDVQAIYKDYLEKPLSDRAHSLLHTYR